MFKVRNGNVQQILKFPCDAEIFNDFLRLIAEISIDIKCRFCVDMRHLKVVLKHIDNPFVQCLKKNQQVFDEHSKCGNVQIVVQVVEIKLENV